MDGHDLCSCCNAIRPYWAFEPGGGPCADCRGKTFTAAEVWAILLRDRARQDRPRPDTQPGKETR